MTDGSLDDAEQTQSLILSHPTGMTNRPDIRMDAIDEKDPPGLFLAAQAVW